jgi:Resolvase, N terminal domain
MMAAFAEVERDIIHERTMAGLAAARAQGRHSGRPAVMDGDKLAAARARRERGESPAQIARAPVSAAHRVCRHLAAPSSLATGAATGHRGGQADAGRRCGSPGSACSAHRQGTSSRPAAQRPRPGART